MRLRLAGIRLALGSGLCLFAVQVVTVAHSATVTPPPAFAVEVRDAPSVSEAGRYEINDDGTVVVGLFGADVNKPFVATDLVDGTTHAVATFYLSGDGTRVFDGATLRDLAGTPIGTHPTLPAGFVTAAEAKLDRDGTVVLRPANSGVTLETTTFVSTLGAATPVDLNAGLSQVNLNRGAFGASITPDGRYASFVHGDFVVGCHPAGTAFCTFDVMRRDLTDGSLVTLSTVDGHPSNGEATRTDISDDGRYVSFLSNATDLVTGTTTAATRLYRHDILTGRTVLVAQDIDTSDPTPYEMSGDGMRFAYTSSAVLRQVRIADLALGVDGPAVVTDDSATNGLPCSHSPAMSNDGSTVLFWLCGGTITSPATAASAPGTIKLAFLRDTVSSLEYGGITPTRLYDSRNGDTDTRPNLAGGATVVVPVAGHAGLPDDAAAAVLNVTVTNPTNAGFVTVWPCDSERPTASNLNYVAGQTIPNAVLATLAADGTVCLYTHAAADLIVDVGGSFGASTSYGTSTPQRVLDTRTSESPTAPPTLAAGSVTPLEVVGAGELPPDTVAVTLNVTVTKPSTAGFVTVYPCGTEPPTASNLNFVAGQTIANAVISRVSADGRVCLFTQAATDLIVDLNGYVVASSNFAGVTPARIYDSRNGETDPVPNLTAGRVVEVQVSGAAGVPAFASAATLNVTVTNPTAAGFVTVYPCGGDPPTASNLNYTAGQTVPNLVVSNLSPSGTVCLFTKAAADLIVDVTGYVTG